ncbi:MAG TPA: hypothetical protein VGU45_04230 [Microvirga sp.]|jgi:hypothetical protein|nr:hypothetical protein [Microvirga sp.]
MNGDKLSGVIVPFRRPAAKPARSGGCSGEPFINGEAAEVDMPKEYRERLAALQAEKPPEVSTSRHLMFLDDAAAITEDQWRRAKQTGWSPGMLFATPIGSIHGGLIWRLQRRQLTALDEKSAEIGFTSFPQHWFVDASGEDA